MSKLLFCLMGPTASGKTALACKLVRHFPFEIISVDSALIYRDMNIGTAKPSPEELIHAPHHLIDIKNPIESYSAAEFCQDVDRLATEIYARGKIPLLVGGTMMYFNALQKGLSTLPAANSEIRLQLEKEFMERGNDYFYQKLMQIDPNTALRLHAHDKQRVQRALEVFYISGTTLSASLEIKSAINYTFSNFALFPQDRAWLHDRIAKRFRQMIDEGFIEEVIHLQQKWPLDETLPSMRTVGYRQVFEYLKGQYDKKLLLEKGIAATRQLAKRQLTWLRSWEPVNYLDPLKVDFPQVVAKIQEILDNL